MEIELIDSDTPPRIYYYRIYWHCEKHEKSYKSIFHSSLPLPIDKNLCGVSPDITKLIGGHPNDLSQKLPCQTDDDLCDISPIGHSCHYSENNDSYYSITGGPVIPLERLHHLRTIDKEGYLIGQGLNVKPAK
uniref:Uncharacterized protein n=1 Tax=Marseillevirus LCMAC101 TaxID=2506602 RepID=A0A481YS07_9VIRU|nr:MAG: hypothetical protein LCMAC101_01020 [Marseillevirus LCMAC101]